MNKILLFCLIGLFVSSCNNNGKNEATSNTATIQKNDTTVPAQKDTIPQNTQPKETLRNRVIDDKYFQEKNKSARALTATAIKAMGLTAIAGISSQAVTPVKIIDTLFEKGNNKIIIVSMETENESFAWVVQLLNGKTTRFEQVYYADVVEYIQMLRSIVSDSSIEITTQTDIGEGKVSKSAAMVNFNKLKLEKAKPATASKEKPDTTATK